MGTESRLSFDQIRKNAEGFLQAHSTSSTSDSALSQALGIISSLLSSHTDTESEINDLQYFENPFPNDPNFFQKTLDNHPAALYRVRVVPAKTLGNTKVNPNNPAYVFDFTSDRFTDILGISQAEFKKKISLLGDGIYPEDKIRFVKDYFRASDKCIPFCWEGRIIVNKKTKWIRIESIPQKQANNEIVWTGILEDTTERKNTEYELYKTKVELEDIINGANIGTLEWNIQTGKLKFNDIWARNLGYSNLELKIGSVLFGSKGWKLMTHPDDIAYADLMLQRHFSGELAQHEVEIRMRHKKGHWVWMRQVGKVKTWTDDGKPLQMYGIHTNIDDRKKTELELSVINDELERRVGERTAELEMLNADLLKSEQKFRTISDFIYDWEYWESPEQKMIFISPSVYRITGYTVNEFEDNPGLLNDIVHSYDKEIWNNHIANQACSAQDGDNRELNFRIVSKQGETRWINHICRFIFVDGKYLGMRVSNRDITEKVTAERQLHAVTVEVEEKERNRFSRELHDGMGPLLSTIKLYFQWLSENTDEKKNILITDKGNQCIDAAIQTARELSRGLSSQLLSNSGFVLAMHEFVSRINETTKIKINFMSDIDKRFSPFMETSLYRIATELLKNTITYANASLVNINFEYMANNKLRLSYSDNGIGFDYKSVLNDSRGLGLKNIQQRVKLFRGSIDIQSAPNEGMAVTIQFSTDEFVV